MKLTISRSRLPCHLALTLRMQAYKALHLCYEFLLTAFSLPATRAGFAKRMFNFKSIVMSKKPTQLPLKPVLTSSAQTVILCPASGEVQSGLNARVMEVLQNSNISETDKAVIEIMFLYGLRISEVMAINSNSVNSRNQIIIKGLKGSQNRLVVPVIFSDYWQKVRNCGCLDHAANGRFYYYRLFRRLGFRSLSAGNEKESVTHFFRHNFVNEIMKETNDLETAKELIGHKNINSTKFYNDEERSNCKTKRGSNNRNIGLIRHGNNN